MTFIKLEQADLDSPRRELSNSGLENVVVLLVRWQIIFVCVFLTLNPAVALTVLSGIDFLSAHTILDV